jgi:D-alanyl-D-alanine carboxypeptidase
MKNNYKFILSFLVLILFLSCFRNSVTEVSGSKTSDNDGQYSALLNRLSFSFLNAQTPQHISEGILLNIANDPSFILELFSIKQQDPYLRILVDKNNALCADYEPEDLVELVNLSFRVNRSDMMLRKPALESLEEMAQAARAQGITLLVSSAYRSYSHQQQVYLRNVRQLGQAAADRVSARPGHSQHQLGLVVDFGSITNDFAQTPQGIWVAANASRFGWSLSYPENYEEITGYSWESWHYRYVGKELAQFIDVYFDGIQQYALSFIHEWENFSHRESSP